MTFLPFALVFGQVSQRAGVNDAGWTLIAVAILTVLLLIWTVRGFVRAPAAVPLQPAFRADEFLPADDPEWPGHWVHPPETWDRPGVAVDSGAARRGTRRHRRSADRPTRRRRGARRQGPFSRGDPPRLQLEPAEALELLNQARGHVRNRLDQHFKDTTSGEPRPLVRRELSCDQFVELVTAYLERPCPTMRQRGSTPTSPIAPAAATFSSNGAPSSGSPAS